MKFCAPHWRQMRATLETHGLSGIGAKTAGECLENIEVELKGGKTDFDPLMSMHWHYMNAAIANGGLYLMKQDPSGKNEGHYCPLCEFEARAPGFETQADLDNTASLMAAHARELGLLPRVS